MDKKVIIIMGPPGSGKGTQANLLAEKFKFFHLETSKLIEEVLARSNKKKFIEANGKKYYFKNQKKIYQKGGLADSGFVSLLIREKVKDIAQKEKGIIFSGSPRTIKEAEALMPFLKKLYRKDNIKIFHLDLKAEKSIFRNSHRRICELMRHSILYNKETKNLSLCPLDGSRLVKRELDKPQIIKKRFQVYEKQTLPVLDWLKKQDFVLYRINGNQSVADVFSSILKKLKLKNVPFSTIVENRA